VEPPSGLQVSADSVRIKQVFANLFANALRYVPSGGWIRVSVRPTARILRGGGAAEGLEVLVDNNGPPLEESQLEAVFERFYRGEESRNREAGGRGLGLSICRQILRNHGGEIRAERLPGGEGTRFAFFLPF